jgi:hypothetical protein
MDTAKTMASIAEKTPPKTNSFTIMSRDGAATGPKTTLHDCVDKRLQCFQDKVMPSNTQPMHIVTQDSQDFQRNLPPYTAGLSRGASVVASPSTTYRLLSCRYFRS